MTTFDIILLIFAGLGAGIINAIAGGGSFLTFPALVFTGVPTIAANATSALAVFPGYLSGALGFLKELKTHPARQIGALIGLSILGGVLGQLGTAIGAGSLCAALFKTMGTSDRVSALSYRVLWIGVFGLGAMALITNAPNWPLALIGSACMGFAGTYTGVSFQSEIQSFR